MRSSSELVLHATPCREWRVAYDTKWHVRGDGALVRDIWKFKCLLYYIVLPRNYSKSKGARARCTVRVASSSTLQRHLGPRELVDHRNMPVLSGSNRGTLLPRTVMRLLRSKLVCITTAEQGLGFAMTRLEIAATIWAHYEALLA